MPDWDKAKAAAQKALGKDGKIPDTPSAVTKALADFDKANDAFKEARKECESKLLDIQNAVSGIKHAMQQFKATVEKSDFDLDPKGDKQKIQQAEKILSSDLAATVKHYDGLDKTLDELDKHLIQLGKYKAPPNPI